MSDAEIRAIAAGLPLAERYDLHVEVLQSRLPPNRVVIYDIVALGDPAWRYTIGRASRSVVELDRALDVLDAFGRYCTEADRRILQNTVRALLNDGTEERRQRLARVDEVCGVTSPRHGPEKYVTWPDTSPVTP